MTVFRGYVRVKETNEPIDGLIVSIYAESETQPDPKIGAKISNPFQYYTRSLGSTITNQLGEFRIEVEQSSLVPHEKSETKKILAVLAPASPEGINRLSATPPSKRLLHWDHLPSMGDDQSEACVICLPAEQLGKHEIKLQQDRLKVDIEKRVEQFVKAEEDSIRLQKALRKGLAPIRKEQLKRKREIKDKAKQFAAKLSATPKAVRTQSNFVTSKDEVETVTRAVMEKGLKDIKKALEEDNNPVLALSVTMEKGDLATMGLDIGPASAETLDLNPKQLCQLLHRRQGGTELVRVRGLLDSPRRAYPGLEQGKARPVQEKLVECRPLKTKPMLH